MLNIDAGLTGSPVVKRNRKPATLHHFHNFSTIPRETDEPSGRVSKGNPPCRIPERDRLQFQHHPSPAEKEFCKNKRIF